MSHTVAVLCRPEVAAGFALAGMSPVEVDDGVDAGRRLGDVLADDRVGVVLTQQCVFDDFDDALKKRLERWPVPMVVPFPDPAWESPREAAEAYIVELLRQVVGYRVRLR